MDTSIFLCLLLASLRVGAVEPPVVITPDRATLREGNSLRVICKSNQPLDYCRFSVPGVGGLNLAPNHRAHEGLHYTGNGLAQGECGLEIPDVRERHNGNLACTLGFLNHPIEGGATMRLTVAKAPPAPILKVDQGTQDGGSYREGEIVRASCRVENSRPVSNITWFIDEEPIFHKLSQLEFYDGPNDLKTVVQNLTHKLRYTDNGRNLRCIATHMAQGANDINSTLFKLNVRFPPKPPSTEYERFGFQIGKPGNIVVQVYANPQPQFEWELGNERLFDGNTDRTGRLQSRNSYKGLGMWDVTLSINPVTSEEVDKKFKLTARNDLGQEEYRVAISTSPAPPPEMTAGAIVGIIIAILLIVLLIFMLVFARATGRWCFAADDKDGKNASDAAANDEKQGKDGLYASVEIINGQEKEKIATKASAEKINTPV